MLLRLQEEACPACGTPYVRSSLTHECLPLVEFQLAEGLTETEVSATRRSGLCMPLPMLQCVAPLAAVLHGWPNCLCRSSVLLDMYAVRLRLVLDGY